jgi:glycosyltransferase involved in cell wall biosynthesis
MLTELYDERMQYQENLFAKYYGKHGHKVTILASTIDNMFEYHAGRERHETGAQAREYWDGGAKVIKLPLAFNFLNRLKRLKGVPEILEREQPDLIFSHDIHLNLGDAVAYRRAHPHCRIILDYHADSSNSGRTWLSRLLLHRFTRKRLLRACLEDIDRIYPVVPAGADFLHDLYGIPRDRMELLPLAPDTDLAKDIQERGARRDVRRALGIPEDALVAFTGGKLVPEKRTHLLIEAVMQIADPRLHLIVAGAALSSDSYGDLIRAAAEGNPRVHFTGWIPATEVYRYMAACDFAVFPASQSVLWQQALGMGLPLVVGSVGVQDPSYMNKYGALTILRETEIVEPVIRAKIRELITDRALLASGREAALRTANELLNYHILVERTLAAPSAAN